MFGHLVFDGPNRMLKFFLRENDAAAPELRHQVECHDVGVRDGQDPDAYGHDCKCPPGRYYLGAPQGTPGEAGYGNFFTPLVDTGDQAMAKHGRAGIGIHGGGSDLADPFAPQQGWEWTFGCLRLQNSDNDTVLVPFVRTVRASATNPDQAVILDVLW